MPRNLVAGLVGAIRGAAAAGAGYGYIYDALPAPATHGEEGDAELATVPLRRGAAMVKVSVGAIALLGLLFAMASISRSDPGAGCELAGNCTEDTSRLWGQYSPYFAAPSDMDPRVPAGCEVTMAQVLSRHGARWPTAKKSAEYRAAVERIRGAARSFGSGLEFLEDYEYGLGRDELTGLGARQMAESGAAFFRRYEALARGAGAGARADMFVRASGSARVVASADNFTRGFYGAAGADPAPALAGILVLPETGAFNNTLEHVACPRFEEGPAAGLRASKQRAWLETWAPPIRRRLEAGLPGANVTLAEVEALMDLCPFSTVASDPGDDDDDDQVHGSGRSAVPFCRLFSRAEWASYDYHQSLGKWYGYGQGNPLGPSQGIGFGNELIARLTGQPVADNTTTNRTLDASRDTFPLDRALYADFSHDNTMSSIFAALGLFRGTRDLPARRRVSPRRAGGFSAAWAVPFSARMYVEKMRCGGENKEEEEEEFVRVLLNDRVVPLHGCGMDELGRCALGAFVESLSFVRGGGLWGTCQDVP